MIVIVIVTGVAVIPATEAIVTVTVIAAMIRSEAVIGTTEGAAGIVIVARTVTDLAGGVKTPAIDVTIKAAGAVPALTPQGLTVVGETPTTPTVCR